MRYQTLNAAEIAVYYDMIRKAEIAGQQYEEIFGAILNEAMRNRDEEDYEDVLKEVEYLFEDYLGAKGDNAREDIEKIIGPDY